MRCEGTVHHHENGEGLLFSCVHAQAACMHMHTLRNSVLAHVTLRWRERGMEPLINLQVHLYAKACSYVSIHIVVRFRKAFDRRTEACD